MEKEIKFRAWHTEQKRMFDVYGLGPDFVTEDTFDGVNYGNNAFCNDDMNFIVIRQFTGLIDKNGNEIYHGDILMDSMKYVIDWGEFNCEEFTFIGWLMRHKDKRVLPFGLCQADASVCDVIGNIYQNPELI